MDKLRQWVALTVVAILVIVAGAWFLLVSPKRSEAADLRSQADTQINDNRALLGKISLLKTQQKTLPQKQAKLAAVAAKIPSNPDLPSLIRALTVAADDAGVELVSMAPSPPVPAAAAAAAGKPATGTTTTGTGATTTGTAATKPATPGANAGLLESIALNLNVVGGYFQIEQFFDRVESLSRAMKVSSLLIAPGTNPIKVSPTGQALPQDGTLVANITATVYMATGRTTAAVLGK